MNACLAEIACRHLRALVNVLSFERVTPSSRVMSDEEESDALGTVDEREYDVLSAVGLDRLRAKLGTRAPLSIARDRFSNSLAPAQPRPYLPRAPD